MKITLKDLYENIETLPENLFKQVNDFINFLKFQNSETEYVVPEWQKEETRRRRKLASENPESFLSESEMEAYLKELEN